jgi:Lon protease-like protein
MFPLQSVLFPGGVLALHVFEPRYRAMIVDCLGEDRSFGVVLISRGSEVGGGDQRVTVGTEARIEDASPFADGRWAVVASGLRRIAVESWLPDNPYPLASVRTLPESPGSLDRGAVETASGVIRRARALLSELGEDVVVDGSPTRDEGGDNPEANLWHLCSSAPLGPMDRQRLLEIDDASERVAVLTDLLVQVVDDLHRILGAGSS